MFRSRLGEWVWAAACVAAWFVVRAYNLGKPDRLSYLAVVAVLTAVLNPAVVDLVAGELGASLYDTHDELMRWFRAIFLSIALGVVAVIRIHRSRGCLRGVGAALGAIVLSFVLGLVSAAAMVIYIAWKLFKGLVWATD